jgi:hypothetical protein
LIINPDFAIGDDATSEIVLGVDMNGWHAVSGFLIVVPVLACLFNEDLLPWLLAASAAALLGTAVWAAFSAQPALGLFYFTNQAADVLLHIFTGSIFVIGAALGFRGMNRQLS